MILGISGKKQSGKDTIKDIILRLDDIANPAISSITTNNWQVKRFADKLKDIVCLITGCTRGQLEDNNFKDQLLPDEWIRYGYADGFIKEYIGNGEMGNPVMINKQCDKETYEAHYNINWQTAYKAHITYREMLQIIGTDLFRKKFHDDTWVNATMADYKPKICSGVSHCALAGKPKISCWHCPEYPNWIIPDVRFPNEVKAIKDRGGIIIRVERDSIPQDDHLSETALDGYTDFDYVVNNNNTLDNLESIVKTILIELRINKLIK